MVVAGDVRWRDVPRVPKDLPCFVKDMAVVEDVKWRDVPVVQRAPLGFV